MVVGDAHFRVRIPFIFCDDDIKYMSVVYEFDLDRSIFKESFDLIHLIFGDLGDDLKFFVRISRDDPGGCSGGDAFEMICVRDDHAFHIFDDAPADLQHDPVRNIAQHFTGSGGSVCEGDGLGTPEGGDQFFLEDLDVGFISNVVFFHMVWFLYFSCVFFCVLELFIRIVYQLDPFFHQFVPALGKAFRCGSTYDIGGQSAIA